MGGVLAAWSLTFSTISGIQIPVMAHIEQELARIRGRLAAYPDPFEHAGLYAAQQALSWAAQPEMFKSPFSLVTGTPQEPADYPAHNSPSLS